MPLTSRRHPASGMLIVDAGGAAAKALKWIDSQARNKPPF